MVFYVDIVVRARTDGVLYAPVGLSSPQAACNGVIVNGAKTALEAEASAHHPVLVLRAEEDTIAVRHVFAPTGSAYPEAIYRARDTRFTYATRDEVARLRAIHAFAGVRGLVRHAVAEEQSHQELHQRLLVSLRSAGISAGLVHGYAFEDSGCGQPCDWLVTRKNSVASEWYVPEGADELAALPANRPGTARLAVSHSVGWVLPSASDEPFRCLAAPMWRTSCGEWVPSDPTVSLIGYGVERHDDLYQSAIA